MGGQAGAGVPVRVRTDWRVANLDPVFDEVLRFTLPEVQEQGAGELLRVQCWGIRTLCM